LQCKGYCVIKWLTAKHLYL